MGIRVFLYRVKEEIHCEIEVNYLLTKVVQFNKYYKSRAVGVTSEVGLTTDRDLAEPSCLRNTKSFIPPWYRKSRGTSHCITNMITGKSTTSLLLLPGPLWPWLEEPVRVPSIGQIDLVKNYSYLKCKKKKKTLHKRWQDRRMNVIP